MILVWLVGCQAATPPTPLPTYTPYPTYTPPPTYTPYPTPVARNLPSAQQEDLIWPLGPRDDVIPAEDAAAFIGEQIAVEGIVKRTHNAGSAVFLNFAESSQPAFTAVIFPDDWPKFPSPPENLFAGKLVRVQGVIQEYNGAPEIIITEPYQIEVALTLGQAIPTECNCPTPPSTATTSAPAQEPTAAVEETPVVAATAPAPTATAELAAIPWQNAAGFAGQTVTIAGQVVNTYNSDKVVFLNFDEDYQNTFKIVIFPDAWPLFPEPPETYYRGKTVQVTGEVKLYQNAPEIIIDHPDQIVIVE